MTYTNAVEKFIVCFKKEVNCQCVICSAATDFTVTQERSTVMTFAQPITRIYHSLFIRNPADQPNYVAYTEPLHFLTWAALGLLIVITPPFLYVAVK